MAEATREAMREPESADEWRDYVSDVLHDMLGANYQALSPNRAIEGPYTDSQGRSAHFKIVELREGTPLGFFYCRRRG